MSVLSRDTELQGEKGRYRILRVLLFSAMGIEYIGLSDRGSYVIIKTARYHGDGRDHARLELLELEVAVHSLIPPHENIVGYVDTVRHNGQLCLVLEFLEGSRLLESYSERPGNESAVKDLVGSLLRALAHLHRNGIIHRDVTPMNIMVHPQRKLVLLDFGTLYVMEDMMALPLSQDTLKHAYRCNRIKVGGHNWNAPELWKTQSTLPSPASDIYGAGAVLFLMLTGQEPAPYLTEAGLEKLPHELNPKVSRRLSKTVEKAMQGNPSKRYQTAGEMLLELGFREEPAAPSPANARPRIVLAGVSYGINDTLEIGRRHVCGDDCRKNGFGSPLNVPIDDPKSFISKHHARISKDRNGKVFMTDLRSYNRTAMRRGSGQFKVLKPEERYEMKDGDELALVYSRKRGPYIKFRFQEW
jgi:serine/threonine protein kinase